MNLTGYLMAAEIGRYASTAEGVASVAARCHADGISLVYLETFRDRFQVPREALEFARDGLRAAGVKVAGAVCTVHYGMPSSAMSGYPCLTSDVTRRELADMMTIAATVFDHVLIDEYIWSHCECDACRAAKGTADWTSFRCAQLAQVCRDFVVAPSRAARSDVRLIYKVPGTFEEWARQGQDVALLSEVFDGIWVGTEIGPFQESPQHPIRCQGAYRAFVIVRWTEHATAGHLGGSWVMPISDAGLLRDSVIQTVMGGAAEIVLHPWGGMAEPYEWVFRGGKGQLPAILADADTLNALSKIVADNPPRGLAAVRDVRALPWRRGVGSDANAWDAFGQLGIPVLPYASPPSAAEGWLLTMHSPELTPSGDGPMIATDGFLQLRPELADDPRVVGAGCTVPIPRAYDYRGVTDPYDMPGRLRALPADRVWDGLEDGWAWDASMRYEADPAMLARLMSVPFGPPQVTEASASKAGDTPPPGTINAIRDHALRPFGLRMRGPAGVIVQPLGRSYVALHNTNEHPVTIRISWDDAVDIGVALVVPKSTQAHIERDGDWWSVVAAPHSLVCFRRSAN